VTVSASGFNPDDIHVAKGDTVDFQATATQLVTVTAGGSVSDPALLFGTASFNVPSQQTVQTDEGVFTLTAGGNDAMVHVKKGRDTGPVPNPPTK
jgi:plastocyanin